MPYKLFKVVNGNKPYPRDAKNTPAATTIKNIESLFITSLWNKFWNGQKKLIYPENRL